MSATKHHRVAKGMRWAARVIGIGGAVFYLLCWFASLFNDSLILSSAGSIFSRATIIIALLGCFLSWWREWLAGVLLITSWLTSLGVVICAIVGHYGDDAVWWLCYGLPLLVAGVLLLLSWWLSRKTA